MSRTVAFYLGHARNGRAHSLLAILRKLFLTVIKKGKT